MTAPADTPVAPAGAEKQDPRTSAGSSYFVRRVTAMQDFELFFVSAIATILVVRAVLAATGWPQLGGGKIHFAHLLWGGLGMLIAFILFMALQGRFWNLLATLSAGIGFGLFLDELGKFITSDNDYFFQPAVAIMYVVFVALFFLFRWLGRIEKMGPDTALVNAFDFAKQAVMHAMDRGERDEALYVLARADQSDPIVTALFAVLNAVDPPDSEPNAVQRLWSRLHGLYDSLVAQRWFRFAVVGWFVVTSIVSLVGPIDWGADPGKYSLMDIGGTLAGAATGVCVAVGIIRWRHAKLFAYRWFERGCLVAILVGEFFSFYQHQATAIFGLLWLLLTLTVIRAMISAELRSAATRVQQASSGGAHVAHQV